MSLAKFRSLSLALACLSTAGLAHAAQVRLGIRSEQPAPASLWVAAPAAAHDRARWVELERSPGDASYFTARYSGDLAAGRYVFVAATPQGQAVVAGPRMVGNARLGQAVRADGDTPAEQALPLRGVTAGLGEFEVGAEPADLGRFDLLQDGSLMLLVAAVRANGSREDAPADSGVPELLRRLRWIGIPQERGDGGWAMLASGNRLLEADAAGQWRVREVLAGGRATVFAAVTDGALVVGGDDTGMEWVGADGSVQRLSNAGLPAAPVESLQCDADFRCAVALLDAEHGAHWHYSADARAGGWKEIAKFAPFHCGWGFRCDLSAVFLRTPQAVIAIGDGKRLLRLDLASGELRESELPFKAGPARYADGRLVIGEHTSDDEGQHWQELDQRMRDGVPQFDAAGVAYAYSIDIGLRFMRPIVRRRDPGSERWVDYASLPAPGDYIVGRRSPLQFLRTQSDLWVSRDQGRSWSIDAAAYAALGTPAASTSGFLADAEAPPAEPAAVLVHRNLARLRVATQTFVGGGALVGALVQNDMQDAADEVIAPMLAGLPDKLVSRAAHAGITEGLRLAGIEDRLQSYSDKLKPAYFERLKGARELPRGVLLEAGPTTRSGQSTPLALTADHRQLRVSLEASIWDRSRRQPSLLLRRSITVLSDAVPASSPALARERWAADQGRQLRAAITDSLREAIACALRAGDVEPAAKGEAVDLLTPDGGERVYGRLLKHANGRALIVDADGDLWSLPAIAVL